MFFAGLFAMYFTLRATIARGVGEPDRSSSTSRSRRSTPPSWCCPRSPARWACGPPSGSSRAAPARSSQFEPLGHERVDDADLPHGRVLHRRPGLRVRRARHEGLTISSSPYGSVFYLTTGFHGLHVVGGLIAFLFLLGRSFTAKRFGHHEATTAIVVSYYWHFVDVVWIALFGSSTSCSDRAAPRRARRTAAPPDPTARRGSIREGTRRPQAPPARAGRAAAAGAAGHRRPVRRPVAHAGQRRRRRDRRHRGRREAVPGELRHLPRHERRGHATTSPVAHRRRCRLGGLPGRHRPDADADERPAGPGQAAAVRRRADQPARRLRRLAGPRPGDPRPTSRSTPRSATRPTACALFRTNCAMCHNAVGAGGALSEGKYAPPLAGSPPRRTSTRPCSPARSRCPSSTTRTSPPRRSATSSRTSSSSAKAPPAAPTSALGPVSEGLWVWVVGIGLSSAAQCGSERSPRDRARQPVDEPHAPDVGAAAARALPGPGPPGAPAPRWPTPTRRPPSAPSVRSSSCSRSRSSAPSA